MAAGLMLGPSLLGNLAPRAFARLFPPAGLDRLNSLSQIGLVLFMFLVGLAVHPKQLRESGRAALVVGQASIAVPFALALGSAWFLYPRVSDPSVHFSRFALFMGASLSITAFPVLARILTQTGLLDKPLGALAIACSAVGDVTGWCMLAYIVMVVRAAQTAMPFWLTLAGSATFALIMLFSVRRWLRAFETHYVKHGGFTENSNGRGPRRRNELARFRFAGRVDEYPRTDGTGDPEYRPGHRRDLASGVFDDGADGSGDDVYDHSAAAQSASRGLPRAIIGGGARLFQCGGALAGVY
jgi:Sodium/hydrogen exchanger family